MSKPASIPKSSNFSGFSRKTIQFYQQLAKNNRKDWFEEHRQTYEQEVIAPAKDFILTLGPKLQKLSKNVQFDPDPNGRGSFKKIHTDQRFIKDRDPFKTWMDIMFWEGPIKAKKDNSAFYVRITPKTLVFAVGIKAFTPKVLKNYRQHILNSKRAAALEKAVTALQSAGDYTLGGLHYKKPPRDIPVDEDYKYCEYLQYNALFAFTESKLPEDVFRPQLVDLSLHHFEKLAPLHHWLVPILQD